MCQRNCELSHHNMFISRLIIDHNDHDMKELLTILLTLLFLTVSLNAQDIDRPKIGLVLSGGGAHGLAHIGVIRYLEDKGIPVDYVTGTSMGAVIGGLYALGYSSAEIEEIAKAVDWDEVLSNYARLSEVAPSEKNFHDKFALNFIVKDGQINLPQGFINTQKLDLLISRLYCHSEYLTNFDDLPRPFRCMAVDIETGDIKAFDRGYLSKAVRASMAIPSVFPPIEIDGRLYVDGGLIRNLPAQENLELGADILIGAYVGGVLEEKEELNSFFDVLSQSAFMMGILDSEEQKELLDVLIEPDIKDEGSFAFKEVDLFLQKGYQASSLHEEAIDSIKLLLGDYSESQVESYHSPDAVRISQIRFPETIEPFDDFARFKFGKVRPRIYKFDDIETSINKVYGTKHFDNVTYTVDVDEDGRHSMDIFARPKSEIDLYANLNFFTTSGAGLILHADFRNKIAQPSVLKATVRLSDRIGGAIDYSYRLGKKKDYIYKFDADYSRHSFFLFRGDNKLRDFRNSSWKVTTGIAREPNNTYWYGVNIGVREDLLGLTRLSEGLQNYSRTNAEVNAFFEFSTLDQPSFASQGYLVDVIVRHQIETSVFQMAEFEPEEFIPEEQDYTLAALRFKAVASPNSILTATFSGTLGWKSNVSFLDNFRVGGTEAREPMSISFIGLNTDQFHFSELIKGGLELRAQLYSNVYLSLVGDYVSGSRTFQFTEDITDDQQLSFWGYGARLAYDSPLGPITAAHGRNTYTDSWQTNLTLGYTFF